MRHLGRLCLLLALIQSPAHGQSADWWVGQGRGFLGTRDLTNANNCFAAALTNAPNDPTANVFYAATRLLTLADQPAGKALLDQLGFAATNRNVYQWRADVGHDTNGVPLAPTNMSASELSDFMRTNILAEVAGAASNLAVVTDTNFTLALSSNETTTVGVTLDYGDLLLMRAGLEGAKYLGYTIHSWDVDVQLTTLRALLTPEAPTAQGFLAQFTNLLTFAATNELPLASQAFSNAVTLYLGASEFIRGRTNVVRLFNYDPEVAEPEAEFRTTLVDLQRSLAGPVQLTESTNLTVDLRRHFDGAHSVRSFFPSVWGNAIVAGTLPDPTFGGLMEGLRTDQLEELLGRGDSDPWTLETVIPFVARFRAPQLLPNGSLQVTLDGLNRTPFLIEASSDLTTWSPVAAGVVTEGVLVFTDGEADGHSARFYRALDASEAFIVNGTVFDLTTQNPVPDALVVASFPYDPLSSLTNHTDAAGNYYFIDWRLPTERNFRLDVSAPGFSSAQFSGYYYPGDYYTPVIYLAPAGYHPPNDNFSQRIPLSGTNVTATGFNVAATLEAGEPSMGSGRSVWWSWTAPADGVMTVDTSGSSFDNVVTVYTGSSVSSLTRLVYSYHYNYPGYQNGGVDFFVAAGTTYQIAVDSGYSGTSGGRIVLNLRATPPRLPAITYASQSQTLGVGSSAYFYVGATGTAPLTYQWRKDGTNLVDGARIAGATTSYLTIANVQPSDAGNYTVVVTNASGSATSSDASLSVIEFPTGDDFNDNIFDPSRWGPLYAYDNTYPMLVETNGHLVFPGTNVAAQSWLGRQGSYTQDWEALVEVQLDPVALAQDGASVNIGLIVGHDDDEMALGDQLEVWVNSYAPSPTNYYSAFHAWASTNEWVTGYNSVDTLATQATLRITFTAATKTLTAWYDADGSGNGHSWMQLLSQRVDSLGDDWGMNPGSRFVISLVASAWDQPVSMGDGVFFDDFATSGGFLPPRFLPPSITSQPQNSTNLVGTSASFSVTANGTGVLSYQWRKDGTNLVDGGRVAGATAPSLTLGDVQSADAGDYTVVVTNAYGSVTSSVAALTVLRSDLTSSDWRYPGMDRAALNCQPAGSSVGTGTNLIQLWELTNLTSVLIGDVDGDGAQELVATSGSSLLLYSGNGTLKRTIALPRASTVAMLEDVDGDRVPDIGLGGSGSGFATYFYKGNGTLLKAFAGQHAGGTDVYMYPIGFAGGKVLVGYNAGYAMTPRGVASFDYAAGTESWYYQVGPAVGWVSWSVADMDGNGLLDITMDSATVHNGASGNGTTDGDLYLIVVDETGSRRISQIYPSPSNGSAHHVFADMNGDGVCEILGFEAHDSTYYLGQCQIQHYNTTGATLHTFNGPNNISWSYAVGDLDGNSTREVAATAVETEQTYVLDANLTLLQQANGVGAVKLICDVDGDGQREIVTLSGSGVLRVLDRTLTVKATAQAGTASGRVLAADVNGDGRVELVCLTDKLYVLAGTTNVAPAIVTQPTSQTNVAGSTATFSVTARGSIPMSYRWRKDGMDLADDGRVAGATTASLTIADVQLADAGDYTVVVTNAYGSVTSAVARLSVIGFPAGDDFNDNVSDPNRWGWAFLDGQGWPMLVETNEHLTLLGAGRAAQVWTGSAGSYTQDWEALVEVHLEAAALAQDDAEVYMLLGVGHEDDNVALGDRLGLGLDLYRASAMSYGRFFFAKALRDGRDVGENYADTVSTQATLRITFTAANKTLTAWYDVDGSGNGHIWSPLFSQRIDGLGANWGMKDDSRFVIGLEGGAWGHSVSPGDGIFLDDFSASGGFLPPTSALPGIISQPQSRTNFVGSTAGFAVSVSGAEPLGCQWRKDGVNLVDGGRISGATTTNLTIGNVQLSDAGSYTVVVTNAYGSVTSGVAVLTVAPAAGCLGDDFNDNTPDPAKWGADMGEPGFLSETNGRLEFLGSGTIGRPWVGSVGSYTQNWEVVVSAHLGDIMLTQNNSYAGISLTCRRADPYPVTDWYGVSLGDFRSDTGYSTTLHLARFQTNRVEVLPQAWQQTTNRECTLRIAFDATAKTLTGYADGTPVSTVNIAQPTSSWGMTDDSAFWWAVFGISTNFTVTASNEVYADNFQVCGSVPGSPYMVILGYDVDLWQDWIPSQHGERYRYVFEAEVEAIGANRVTVTTPSKAGFPEGEVLDLLEDTGGGQEWWLEVEENSAASLTNRFPDGVYLYTVWFTNGTQAQVSCEACAAWPLSFPQVTPETPATESTVDPSAPITVGWAPWIQTNAVDGRTITFSVDRLGDDSSIVEVDLPATATSYTIPPGTLQPGGRYFVAIEFENICGDGNDKDKSLILQYNTLPSILPGSVRSLPDGHFQFQVSSLPGTVLEIQASTNLANWAAIALVTNHTGMLWFTDPEEPLAQRFYRLRGLSTGSVLGDDFNDNIPDPAKWGEDVGTTGFLSETNGRLEFWGNGELARPWVGSYGSYTQNWEVAVDVHLGSIVLTQDSSYAGIALVCRRKDSAPRSDWYSVGLVERRGNAGQTNTVVAARFWTNGVEVLPMIWQTTADRQGTLRIVFDATAKTLTGYLDGTPLSTVNIGPAGRSWGMGDDSLFSWAVVGVSTNFTLTAGNEVYADNFVVGGSVPGAPPVMPPTGLYITNAIVDTNGCAQFEVVAPSNGVYSVLISTNLQDWESVGTLTGPTNRFVDNSYPRLIADWGRVFVRVAVGLVPRHQLSLNFYNTAGTLATGTATVAFPQQVWNYAPQLEVDRVITLADGTNVFFTGPPASGFTDAPSQFTWVNAADYSAGYEPLSPTSPAVPPPGTWTVNYAGTNWLFNLPDAQTGTRFVVPQPTVAVSSGLLTSVNWVYRDATTGQLLSGPPAFLREVSVEAWGGTPYGQIYNSGDLLRKTTNYTFSTPVVWSDVVDLSISYDDDLGNTYAIRYSK